MTHWPNITYFNPYSRFDKWGDPDKMDYALISCLDVLRKSMGTPIYVTSGYRKGDPRSHGKGIAVDVVCPEVNLIDFYLQAERGPFSGIGIYPDWEMNGELTGGLHLDQDTRTGRWIGLGKGKERTYLPLNQDNLLNVVYNFSNYYEYD